MQNLEVEDVKSSNVFFVYNLKTDGFQKSKVSSDDVCRDGGDDDLKNDLKFLVRVQILVVVVVVMVINIIRCGPGAWIQLPAFLHTLFVFWDIGLATPYDTSRIATSFYVLNIMVCFVWALQGNHEQKRICSRSIYL